MPQQTMILDYDRTDNSKALQAAINDLETDKIVIPDVGLPWYLSEPVFFWKGKSKHLKIEPGVIIMAKAGGFQGKYESMLTIIADDVTIEGTNAELRMLKGDYQDDELYEESQFRHLINVRGARNFNILGLRLTNSGGDGILLTHGPSEKGELPDSRFCSGNIHSVIAIGNLRQGISICSGKDIRVENSNFCGTKGQEPECGVDIEPDRPWQKLENIFFSNCRFDNNNSNGINISLWNYHGSEVSDIDIRFADCDATANSLKGINVQGIDDGHYDGPKGTIKFDNTYIKGNKGNGIHIRNDQLDANKTFKTTFSDTVLFGNTANEHASQICLSNTFEEGGITNIDFGTDFLIVDPNYRSPIEVSWWGKKNGLENIHGTIKVQCDRGFVEPDLGEKLDNVTLRFQSQLGMDFGQEL